MYWVLKEPLFRFNRPEMLPMCSKLPSLRGLWREVMPEMRVSLLRGWLQRSLRFPRHLWSSPRPNFSWRNLDLFRYPNRENVPTAKLYLIRLETWTRRHISKENSLKRYCRHGLLWFWTNIYRRWPVKWKNEQRIRNNIVPAGGERKIHFHQNL